jgi:hypothetical protein
MTNPTSEAQRRAAIQLVFFLVAIPLMWIVSVALSALGGYLVYEMLI